MGTEAGSVVINLESNDNKPRLVEAAQILVSSAAVSNTHIDREPDELNKKLSQLIKCREEEKLAAFLETVEGYYEGQIDQESLLNAKGVLGAWKLESQLQNYCDKTDGLQPGEVAALQQCVQQAEQSPHSTHIHSLILHHAKRRLSSELGKQNMTTELKVQIKEAMHSNDLEQLESLVDIIRAKHLDREFETELWYAQCQFEKSRKSRGQCAASPSLSRELLAAVERRDPLTLKRAIQRAEKVESLTRQVEDAKRALKELEEIEKLKSLHKLKIRNAIKSRDIQRMEQTLHDVKVDGFGEDLKIVISELEMALKRKYLQKRLKGNLNVAIQNLDLVRLRRAINEVTTAGFLSELGVELEEAQGLLSKLERLELIKKAVMELTNGHIAEIKSYSAPPVQVHKVLMALLIVLGEEPEIVRDWFEIQVLLVKTGKLSLKRRIQEYNSNRLSSSSAKRAANIIGDIKSEELHSISKAAKVFYLWTSAVIEDRLSQEIIQ